MPPTGPSPALPSRFAVPACIAVLLLAAGFAYWPGLSGGFLFDDFVNLDALGRYGPVDNWPVFWRYVTSGTADPVGRPLALISFLLDARDWPASPAPFLRTNLIIHLVNGALLFWLLRQLSRRLDVSDNRSSDMAAVLASGAWLLHPLFVSTTLYAVQRQAMLPATFTLLGLIAYGFGRNAFDHSEGRRGSWLMWAGLLGGTALATLSKANGILLPLLAAVLEACIYRPTSPVAPHARSPRGIYLAMAACALAVAVLLLRPLLHLNVDLANRPWTIGERLLTEPRIVIEYLALLVVPRSVSTGLFNDAYPISTSLLHPWTTLPSILLVIGMLCLAWRKRHPWPAFSSAALFFFVAHLLESTSLPLELYFEHRNYLPAMLFFWPLSRALVAWKRPAVLRYGVAAAVLVLLALTTWQRSKLWGQPQQLAALWAVANPSSARAQASAAIGETQAGRPDLALDRLSHEWENHPDDLQIAFNVIDASCSMGSLSRDDARRLQGSLRRTRLGALLMTQWLERAVEVAHDGACKGLDFDAVEQWIQAAQSNPWLGSEARKAEDLGPVRALLALRRRQPNLALLHFNRALRAHPTPDRAARNIVAMASAGHYRQALAHLDYYESLPTPAVHRGYTMGDFHQHVLDWQGYWPHEFAVLRRKLNSELGKPSP